MLYYRRSSILLAFQISWAGRRMHFSSFSFFSELPFSFLIIKQRQTKRRQYIFLCIFHSYEYYHLNNMLADVLLRQKYIDTYLYIHVLFLMRMCVFATSPMHRQSIGVQYFPKRLNTSQIMVVAISKIPFIAIQFLIQLRKA